MRWILLWLVAICSSAFALPTRDVLSEKKIYPQYSSLVDTLLEKKRTFGPSPPLDSLYTIKTMLHQQAPSMNPILINLVIRALTCLGAQGTSYNDKLTVIDYSLPSNQKRLWIFDLIEKKLLFHTYVSHGLTSGAKLTTFFSNKFNSKASSVGVYKTENAYHGRDGISLRLAGLERGFNDNASNRYIVMHGGWYVDEMFIKRYGRAGRSWGCPAVPEHLSGSIINAIKEANLFIIYYPELEWIYKSRVLNCSKLAQNQFPITIRPLLENNDPREEILLTFLSKNGKGEENQAVVVMEADNFEKVFHKPAPVERMLRRQIEHIALSDPEFHQIASNLEALQYVSMASPFIRNSRGYALTQMKILPFGTIKAVEISPNTHYTVQFEKHGNVHLTKTNRFIRWLGL
jgi:L,D-transpeptidase catalytic domain